LQHRLNAFGRLVVTGLALGVFGSSPAGGSAQTRTPGAPGGDGRGASAFLAEYYAEVFQRVEELTAAWREAWREDDLDDLLALYHEDAQLVFTDRAPITGAAGLEAFFETELPLMEEMVTSILDFDASGRMAFLSGNFHLDRPTPDGGVTRTTGRYYLVMLNRQRAWKIRSQFFSVEGVEDLPPS